MTEVLVVHELRLQVMNGSGAGPESRFRRLYSENLSAIAGYAMRRASSAEDAADVVAETFLIAWRRLEAVPAGNEGRLWLYGVARNVLLNHRRAEHRRTQLGLRLAAEISTHTSVEVPDGELSLALRGAMEALAPEERELLSLVVWEGLSSAQLATVLRCSPNAAKIRLHRIRKKLRRELSSWGLEKKLLPVFGHEVGASPGTTTELAKEETLDG
ncbi:MAG: RNA polymerase sigma factor [Actinomycetota bacterium]